MVTLSLPHTCICALYTGDTCIQVPTYIGECSSSSSSSSSSTSSSSKGLTTFKMADGKKPKTKAYFSAKTHFCSFLAASRPVLKVCRHILKQKRTRSTCNPKQSEFELVPVGHIYTSISKTTRTAA